MDLDERGCEEELGGAERGDVIRICYLEKKSIFNKICVRTGMSTTFQWKATYLRIYEQHKVDLTVTLPPRQTKNNQRGHNGFIDDILASVF